MNAAEYDILIENTWMLTEDYKIRKGVSIAIRDGLIAEIMDSKDLKEPVGAKETIDGRNHLWMPGLTDGHMHTCQQLLRGKILDELPMIWTRIMLPFESALTPQAVSVSASLAALEMIKGGTTSFVEAGGLHMDEAAKVYTASGLRAALTLSTMDDKNVPDTMRASSSGAVSMLNEFYDNWNGRSNGRIKVYYSLRSLLSCSEDLITNVFGAAAERGAMVEAHMNEYPNEVNSHLERFGLRPMEYLDRLGALTENFLSAHCILLSEHEIELMRQYHVKAVHCPFSNCGKGVPNAPRLLESNILPALGTDGTAHGGLSLFQEMKIFRSVMNVSYGVPSANPVIMPAETLLNMVLRGGASAMGMEESLGGIKKGFHADLIAIDLDQAHFYPTNNLVHSLLESAGSGDVVHSVIGGRLVMKNRCVLSLDEERIRYETRKYLEKSHLMEDESCCLS